jgi:hypothetical protein
MARGSSVTDVTTLQMALVGYQVQKQKVEERIREIQSELQGKHVASPVAAAASSESGKKRVLSAAARRRIGAAQKRRWAEHRKRKAAEARQK